MKDGVLKIWTIVNYFLSSEIPFTNISQEQPCDIKSIREMIWLIHTV